MKNKLVPFSLLLTLLMGCNSNNNNTPGTVVPEVKLESISFVAPTKTEYKVGEELDLEGLRVFAHYSDETKKELSDNEYQVTGFDSSKMGEVEITIIFQDFTKTFTVTIIENVTLVSIFIVEPDKTIYKVGEELDLTGFQLMAKYSNDEEKEIPESEYQISGFDSSKPGEIIINVSYQGFIKTFKLIVKEEHIKKADRVYIANPAITMYQNNLYVLDPVVMPNEAKKNIKFLVEDNKVLEVNENKVKGIGAGTSLITAYNDENNNDDLDDDEAFSVASFTIEEEDSSIDISIEQDIVIEVGERRKIQFETTGISAASTSFGYYSSDLSIADFANDEIAGIKSGECTITISNSNFRGTSHVTVIDKTDEQGNVLASHIIPKSNSLVVDLGKDKKISYDIYPKGSLVNKKYFQVLDEDVLSVDEEGNITPKKEGRTLIKMSVNQNMFNYETLAVTVKEDTTYQMDYYGDYYQNFEWENGDDLKEKLHDLISKNKTSLNYASPTNWDSNKDADVDLYNLNYMDSVYGNDKILKNDTNTSWQREHAFAASLMTCTTTGNAVKTLGRATDFHNLYAAYSSGNASRTNKNLGEASTFAPDYTDRGTYQFTRNWFEPTSEVDKGKLSRAILYMGVMYNQTEHASYTDSSQKVDVDMPSLNIINDNVGYNRISIGQFLSPNDNNKPLVDYYTSLAKDDDSSLSGNDLSTRAHEIYLENGLPYSIGGLSTLIDWSYNQVSRSEMHHNESVYKYNSPAGKGIQGNRNPFVDYPELVDYVYGDLKDQPGELNKLKPSAIEINLNAGTINNFAIGDNYKKTYKVGDSISAQSLDLKAVKSDFKIVNANENDLESYQFKEEDIGNKEFTFRTSLNPVAVKLNVTDASGEQGEGDYSKATAFDASKTYYVSQDGTNFAIPSISNNALVLSDDVDKIANVTFSLAEGKENEYIVTISNSNSSINLGYTSSTNLSNSKTTWKVESYSDGLILIETKDTGGRYLGLSGVGALTAKAYAYSNITKVNYPPVFLYIKNTNN